MCSVRWCQRRRRGDVPGAGRVHWYTPAYRPQRTCIHQRTGTDLHACAWCISVYYAPHSYPQVTILSQRHGHSDSSSKFSRTASVRQQFPLRAATDETQIWSALFLICCTSRLEHSTAITATTYSHWLI